jgi:ferredoxin-NADP reductase
MIDKFLNQFTTYQVILYWLLALLALGIFFAGLGLVPVNPLAVLETTAGLVAVTLVANWAFSTLFHVTTNQESTVITALILALVLGPVAVEAEPVRFGIVLLGGVFAVASKYLLVWKRHHVFNPVALGIVLTGLIFHEYASWWVGQEVLLPAVLVGGLLLGRKTNRLRFLGVFTVLFAVFLLVWSLVQGLPPDQIVQNFSFTFLQSELAFFAFAMVTEPLTSPKRFVPQVLFLAVVALFSLPQLAVGSFNFSPELALVLANLVAFALGPRGRHTLVLKETRTVAADTLAFAFEKPRGLTFLPGQYLEMTLALEKSDSRGNRRYLSFASSPGEDEVLIAARFPDQPSAFKRRWKELQPGDTVLAAEISGDFVLPQDPREKLAFIAGGIGVTPFRSMVKALVEAGQPRDLVILDSHSLAEHRVFDEVFDEAQRVIGARVVPTLTRTQAIPADWSGERGPVDAALLARTFPDVRDRTYYVSGSPGFVDAVARALRSLKVSRFRIHTDFFPGY